MARWEAVVLVLVGVQAMSAYLPPGPAVAAAAAAGDGLAPINSLCDGVLCGKGKCMVNTTQTLGFVCECEPGWTRPLIGPNFRFLPCIIPNCTLDFSCFHINDTAPTPSLPPAPPSNRSLFDPCAWSHCGGGACVRTSAFGHRCDCNPGFGNLLNVADFPCIKPCVIGFDCVMLGITVPNVSSSSPSSSPAPSPALSGRSPNTATTKFPGSMMWFSLLMAFLPIIPRT